MNEQTQIGQTPQEDNLPQEGEYSLYNLSDRKFGESMEKPQLGGQQVKIVNVKLLPAVILSKTKAGEDYKSVALRLYFNDEKTWENFSGVRMFKRADGSFSEPNIWLQGTNFASRIFKLWLSFRQKKNPSLKIENVSFKEFLFDLKGREVKIVQEQVRNPSRNEMTFKNMIQEFIS